MKTRRAASAPLTGCPTRVACWAGATRSATGTDPCCASHSPLQLGSALHASLYKSCHARAVCLTLIRSVFLSSSLFLFTCICIVLPHPRLYGLQIRSHYYSPQSITTNL